MQPVHEHVDLPLYKAIRPPSDRHGTMDTLIADLQEVYETRIIQRALVICIDDDMCTEIANELILRDHSVVRISMDDLQDERPMFMSKLRAFADGYHRMLVVPYAVWYATRDPHMFIDHNLLVLAGLPHQIGRIVLEYTQQTQTAHDAHAGSNFHVLRWLDEEDV